MYGVVVQEILSGYLGPGKLESELNGLWDSLQAHARCFGTIEEAHQACGIPEGGVPVSWLPMGTLDDGRLIGLHLCSIAAERRIFPWLTCSANGTWAPAGVGVGEPSDTAAGDDEQLRIAPTSFDVAACLAADTHDVEKEASLLALAFKRPIYTAASVDQVIAAQERLVTLQKERGIDFQALRLARAGQDGEAWRLIGAERAIAGRVRDAWVALEGALFFGCNRTAAFKVLEGMFRRGGWEWAGRLLRFHRQRD